MNFKFEIKDLSYLFMIFKKNLSLLHNEFQTFLICKNDKFFTQQVIFSLQDTFNTIIINYCL